jgi:hypothetical protein
MPPAPIRLLVDLDGFVIGLDRLCEQARVGGKDLAERGITARVEYDIAEAEDRRSGPRTGDSGEAERIFRKESERHSGMNPNIIEPSDAGISIVQGMFGFVKRNLSGAQRRKGAASGERGAGKGATALVPAPALESPEREKRS